MSLSDTMVQDRITSIDRVRQRLKDELTNAQREVAAADLAMKQAKGKNDRRLARRAREAAVEKLRVVTNQLSEVKRIRNEVAADSNLARARAFVSIVIEQFPREVCEAIWQEADRRVEALRAEAAARASTRLVGSAIGVRGTAPGMRERA